jgi:hypothetical protein
MSNLSPPLPPDAIRFWMETRLRDALDNPEVIMSALAMLKVAHEAGDTPPEMMRKILADFTFTAFGLEPSGK